MGRRQYQLSPRPIWIDCDRAIEILDCLVEMREFHLGGAGQSEPGAQARIARAEANAVENMPQPFFGTSFARQDPSKLRMSGRHARIEGQFTFEPFSGLVRAPAGSIQQSEIVRRPA